MLTPDEKDNLAGIIAFRHPASDEINRYLHAENIHIMAHAGRLRVSIHGYNTMADVEKFLQTLQEVLKHVGSR